jgi:MFS family permease
MSPVALRLAVMMFLQFFIWGAWYVTAPLYLGSIGFDGADIGWTYSVGPIAAMVSPLFVGMIADASSARRCHITSWAGVHGGSTC